MDTDAVMEDAEAACTDSFICLGCGPRPLRGLADLGCDCALCAACARRALAPQLKPRRAPAARPPHAAGRAAAAFGVGDAVLYLRSAQPQRATIRQVDRSVDPPQYGIQLEGAGGAEGEGAGSLRFTEGCRLLRQPPAGGAAGAGAGAGPGTPAARAPQAPGAAAAFSVGEAVLYLRSAAPQRATIRQVDRSVDPPQYGILLEGRTDAGSEAGGNLRFTEACRLQPQPPTGSPDGAGAGAGAAAWPEVSCPWCTARVPRAAQRRLCPEGCAALEEALTIAWLEERGVVRCPGCEAYIERVAAAPSSAPGAPGGADADRFRCALCRATFCAACRASPYHEGFTCAQHAAPRCTYCGEPALEERVNASLDGGSGGGGGSGSGSGDAAAGRAALGSAQLRRRVAALGADAGWCLERGELLFAYERARQVCGAAECRAKLRQACTKRLACGHGCGGLRGEAPCIPCLRPGCRLSRGGGGAPSGGGDGCAAAAEGSNGGGGGGGACAICLEPLEAAPCLLLRCAASHAAHAACALNQLRAGPPARELSFGFLFCPLCGPKGGDAHVLQEMTAPPHLNHPHLSAALEPHVRMRSEVAAMAKRRLKAEGLTRTAPELQVGGAFDGRPADFAMRRFAFYACARCGKPFYGGARACVPAPDRGGGGGGGGGGGQRRAAAAGEGELLVCGGCSAAEGGECERHGREFIEWKCHYCCGVASWHCWGTTRMCGRCHDDVDARSGNACSPATCRIAGPHPRPGSGEFCLGCGLCRAEQAR